MFDGRFKITTGNPFRIFKIDCERYEAITKTEINGHSIEYNPTSHSKNFWGQVEAKNAQDGAVVELIPKPSSRTAQPAEAIRQLNHGRSQRRSHLFRVQAIRR